MTEFDDDEDGAGNEIASVVDFSRSTRASEER
jgi:hypothetical protein